MPPPSTSHFKLSCSTTVSKRTHVPLQFPKGLYTNRVAKRPPMKRARSILPGLSAPQRSQAGRDFLALHAGLAGNVCHVHVSHRSYGCGRLQKSLVYWGYSGIMENRMEATNIGIMEKKMETTIVI